MGQPGFEPESQRPERHRIDQATPRARERIEIDKTIFISNGAYQNNPVWLLI